MTVSRKALFFAVLFLSTISGVASADPSAVRWRAWQSMPVFYNGRMMPLDTFAREKVEDICGRVRPKLTPPDIETDAAGSPFPDGKPRRFSAAELLYEWSVRPEAWERVAFIRAEYEPLREEVLGVPLTDRGVRLHYVSPRDIERCRELSSRLEQMQERQRRATRDGRPFEMTVLEKKAQKLYEAYVAYRLLSFNPENPAINRTRFDEELSEAAAAWRRFEPEVSQLAGLRGMETGAELLGAARTGLVGIMEVLRKPDWKLEEMEPRVAAFAEATGSMARQLATIFRKFKSDPPDWPPEQRERAWALFASLVAGAERTSVASEELFESLYDNGGQMPLVPSLNPRAAQWGTGREEAVPAWLSLQTVLYASDAYLSDYPAKPVEELRAAWKEAAKEYTSENRDGRATSKALGRFVASVRKLSEAIEPARKALFEKEDNEEDFEKTTYPPAGATMPEVLYNTVDPFLWAWATCLASVVFFALSFGIVRRPMMGLGILASLTAQGWMAWALTIRSIISGRAPVANMFETIVFVAMVVSFLGTWMTLVPLLWNGLSAAWHLTAWPWASSPVVTGREPSAWLGEKGRKLGTYIFFIPRLILVVFVGRFLLLYDPGQGTRRVISLLPETFSLDATMAWLAGMGVLLCGIWFLPRAALALVASLWAIPAAWRKIDRFKALKQFDGRKTVALAGAVICFLVALLAYVNPAGTFDKSISPLMPVLRNNFWLLIHVITITASYGAGALAWGLSNIAMAYYLFGRYRKPVRPSTDSVAGGHSPVGGMKAPAKRFPRKAPEACATLAAFSYKAIQVAVLLLAVGTILGGLWAAVSWGRFWGWDPKEVWALISLLVYLAVLHGRYAGWTGNFALHVGAIIGASSIVVAWYGVNYWMGVGMHSYGRGSGGTWVVLGVMAANWLFVAAAAVRYAVVQFNPVEPETAGEESWD